MTQRRSASAARQYPDPRAPSRHRAPMASGDPGRPPPPVKRQRSGRARIHGSNRFAGAGPLLAVAAPMLDIAIQSGRATDPDDKLPNPAKNQNEILSF